MHAKADRFTDRRAHERRHIDPALGVHATFMDEGIDAAIRDLSMVGVLVEIPAADVAALPGLNATVRLAMRLGDGPPLRCAARVVWLGGSHRHGQRHFRAGLAFGDCAHEQRDRPAAFIDALPG